MSLILPNLYLGDIYQKQVYIYLQKKENLRIVIQKIIIIQIKRANILSSQLIIEVAERLDTLKYINCTHILCVTCTIGEKFPDDFKYMVIKVQDFEYENLLLHFNNGLDFIKEGLQSGGTVFVHCNAGVSRSASFVIAYLMRELDYEFQAAHDFVKQKRPQVFPNKGFLRQLKQYEHDLLKLKLQQKYRVSQYY